MRPGSGHTLVVDATLFTLSPGEDKRRQWTRNVAEFENFLANAFAQLQGQRVEKVMLVLMNIAMEQQTIDRIVDRHLFDEPVLLQRLHAPALIVERISLPLRVIRRDGVLSVDDMFMMALLAQLRESDVPLVEKGVVLGPVFSAQELAALAGTPSTIFFTQDRKMLRRRLAGELEAADDRLHLVSEHERVTRTYGLQPDGDYKWQGTSTEQSRTLLEAVRAFASDRERKSLAKTFADMVVKQ